MGGLPSQGGGGPKELRHVKTSVSGNIIKVHGHVKTSVSGDIVQISGQCVSTSEGIPYYIQVAKGDVPGTKLYNIAGFRTDISSIIQDDITEIPGVSIIPTPDGQRLAISSSSVSDTNGGTGIRKVMIHYLDTNYDEQNEEVIMNGLIPRNTVAANIQRVQWVHATEVGSNSTAVGDISLKNLAGTVTYAIIKALGNQSLAAKYTIPNGKTGYIMSWHASGVTKRMTIRLRATVRKYDRVLMPGVFTFQDLIIVNNTVSPDVVFQVSLKCPTTSDIKISAIGDVAGGDAGGGFQILLIDD